MVEKTFEAKVAEITPIKVLTLNEIAKEEKEDKEYGLECLRTNKVALLLVAGGMGTRLGSSNPKGMYNVGLTRELYIFECQINNILDVVKEAGVYPYLFIMTSPKNDVATRNFFKEKNYFGYDASKVHFFIQNMAPIVDMNGKVLLEEKGQIALSPNGNGGWFTSFVNSGLMNIVKEEGIEYFNLYAVDNVLQRIADPAFLGATILENKMCGAKVVRKANPEEKVGAMCLQDGKPHIIEYYELSEDMKNQTNPDGSLVYGFGVILNYLFPISRLKETLDNSMPLHVVEKKVPFIDENNNGVLDDDDTLLSNAKVNLLDSNKKVVKSVKTNEIKVVPYPLTSADYRFNINNSFAEDFYSKKEVFATIESDGAATELYMPVAGHILEINPALTDSYDALNQEPLSDGWLVKVEPADYQTDIFDLYDYHDYKNEN